MVNILSEIEMRVQPVARRAHSDWSGDAMMTLNRIGFATLLLLCVSSAVVAAGDTGAPEVRTAPARREGTGIWKAAVPPAHMKAEFDGHDPLGLAAGVKIKADCSLNWINPDTRKLYCFSSATSQSIFQDWPKANIERARKFWEASNSSGS